MDDKTTPFNADSSAVQTHLSIMQDIIQRMAENSRSCKTWCITIVSAVLVLVARVERPDYILIALAPAYLFLFLDTYYLALERGFRKSYETYLSGNYTCSQRRHIFGPLCCEDNRFTPKSFFSKPVIIFNLALLSHAIPHNRGTVLLAGYMRVRLSQGE